MTDARDVAVVAARVLLEFGQQGKAYDVTGPEAPRASLRELAEPL